LPAIVGISIGCSGPFVAAAVDSITDQRFGWGVKGIGLLIVYCLVLWTAMPALSKAICSWKSAEQADTSCI
jgi:hypothetical protein